MSVITKMAFAVLRPVWRLTRGMTLGVQAMVMDKEGKILLVRHGYRPGWHFPGGGVEWNESTKEALARELFEETGIEARGDPELHGIFTNFEKFKGDHICVFMVKNWHQKKPHIPNAEIKEIGFFSYRKLPEGTVKGVKNRLREVLEQAPQSQTWHTSDNS